MYVLATHCTSIVTYTHLGRACATRAALCLNKQALDIVGAWETHEALRIAAKLRPMPIGDESVRDTENEDVDPADNPGLSPRSALDGVVMVPLEASWLWPGGLDCNHGSRIVYNLGAPGRETALGF